MDSLITNLKNPIGGCYKSSSITNSSTSEYPSYALGGGGPTKGQAWIYVKNAVRVRAFLLAPQAKTFAFTGLAFVQLVETRAPIGI